MAYIGNTQLNQNYVPAVDFFSGNGSTTAFTLSRPVASVAAVQAVISNVPQDPGTAFTVSGSTITFTSAPPSGTNNIYVYYTSPNTQVVQPGQGTVGTTQLQSNLTLTNPTYTGTLTGGTGVVNIGSGQVYKDSSGNVGIGTSSPDNYTGRSCLSINGSSGGIFTLQLAGTLQFRGYVNSGSTTLQAMTGTLDVRTTDASALTLSTNSAERMRIDSSGNLLFNSGYGSVATAYGCRAWVNFNGTVATPSTIRGSGNVTSVTKNGTGAYVVNLTNALPDTNYCPVACGNNTAGTAAINSMYSSTPVSTTTFTVNITSNGGGPRDDAVVCAAVFR